ncbi:hypothetical protein MRB53_041612 [Persea americana]|nr:hypothetical protein MRB53_041612 [Persea americana]
MSSGRYDHSCKISRIPIGGGMLRPEKGLDAWKLHDSDNPDTICIATASKSRVPLLLSGRRRKVIDEPARALDNGKFGSWREATSTRGSKFRDNLTCSLTTVMPICIECRYPVNQLYTAYSKADDRALGKGVRLIQCPRCKRFADKYVEHDFVILFIDLVLIKPQVYRHLLFNRLGNEDDRLNTHLREAARPSSPTRASSSSTSSSSSYAASKHWHSTSQYDSLARHTPTSLSSVLPQYRFSNRVSTALLVSSCTKLFPILMVIWDYDLPSSASAVSWAVIVNNVAALEILLDCGYIRAALLAGVGAVARAAVGWALLRSMGVEAGSAALGVVETADVVFMWRWVQALPRAPVTPLRRTPYTLNDVAIACNPSCGVSAVPRSIACFTAPPSCSAPYRCCHASGRRSFRCGSISGFSCAMNVITAGFVSILAVTSSI